MKTLKYLIPAVAMVFGLASCSNMDELYKDQKTEYSIYSSKVTGQTVQPGFERATLNWTNPTDFVAVGVEISWNEGADVVKIDSLASTHTITGLSSATYTFEIRTFDAHGNKSLPQKVSAKVYGQDDLTIVTKPSFVLGQSAAGTHTLTIKNLSGAMNMWGGKLILTIDGTEPADLSQTFNILEKKSGGYYSRAIDKTIDLGVTLPEGTHSIKLVHSQHPTSFKQKQSGVFYYTAICVDPVEFTAEGSVVVTAPAAE